MSLPFMHQHFWYTHQDILPCNNLLMTLTTYIIIINLGICVTVAFKSTSMRKGVIYNIIRSKFVRRLNIAIQKLIFAVIMFHAIQIRNL
jgi:hypothetical protein